MGDFQPEAHVKGVEAFNLIALICNKNPAVFSALSLICSMLQMYKVFVNQTLLEFRIPSEGSFITGEYLCSSHSGEIKRRLQALIMQAEENPQGILSVVTPDPEETFANLLHSCRYVPAAGGIVSNKYEEMLVIFRKGKWDLPKGKKEDSEDFSVCAIRETQEETGVTCELSGHNPFITHHLYIENDHWIHKETWWYKMTALDSTFLIPQPAEGITVVRWANAKFLNGKVFPNTYPLIREVLTSTYPQTI